MRPALFLTEAGLYKYLLQAKGAKAEEFQRFVYKLLKEEKKRTVDAIQLALKIERSKNVELQCIKSSLERNETRLYKAANTARETSAQLEMRVAKLKKAKNATEDAMFMRSMGRGHLMVENEDTANESEEGDETDEDE